MRKLNKIIRLLFATVFVLTFFSCLRILAIYYYHLQAAKGNQTLAMILMDKVDAFNFTTYATGWLHGWVLAIMILICLDR